MCAVIGGKYWMNSGLMDECRVVMIMGRRSCLMIPGTILVILFGELFVGNFARKPLYFVKFEIFILAAETGGARKRPWLGT